SNPARNPHQSIRPATRRHGARCEPCRAATISEAMMARRNADDLIPVESLDDIPDFANEDEEAEFWATHSFGERLLDQMGPIDDGSLPPPRERTRPVAIR